MLTRHTRQRRSIAAPSRGRLSVHRQTVPSSLTSTRTLHPEKSTVSASRDLRPQPQHRQYFRIVLEPIPIRSDTVSTTSYESIRAFDYATIRLHAHTVLLHSKYNIVLEYDSITSTSCSRPRTIRLLSHHVHGRASRIVSDHIIVSHTSPWEILAVLDTVLPICLDLTYFTFTQYSTVYRDKSASVSVSTYVLSATTTR